VPRHPGGRVLILLVASVTAAVLAPSVRAAAHHPLKHPLPFNERRRYELVETVTVRDTGVHTGRSVFRVAGRVEERLSWRPGQAQHLELLLSGMRVREGHRVRLVHPFSLADILAAGQLRHQAVAGLKIRDANFRMAAPILERTLAYVLEARPSRGTGHWQETERYWYRNVPVTLRVHYHGRPRAMLAARTAIPSRPAVVGMYHITIGGQVAEQGLLELGPVSGAPQSYQAVTSVTLVGRLMGAAVEQEQVTIRISLKEVMRG
jgi:hypothetical protein